MMIFKNIFLIKNILKKYLKKIYDDTNNQLEITLKKTVKPLQIIRISGRI